MLPRLRSAGVRQEDIDQMMVANPRRLLAQVRAPVKAALLVAPGRVIVDDVPDDHVGPDDVQILVGGVGLCGSDASVFSGKWPTPSTPWIMGHEAFGTVVAVGERVPEERIGETVVVEPNLACFRCGPCQRGLTSACENRLSVGMNRPGALAERLVVPSRFAWRVDGLEPDGPRVR